MHVAEGEATKEYKRGKIDEEREAAAKESRIGVRAVKTGVLGVEPSAEKWRGVQCIDGKAWTCFNSI